jgi:hypothetical protein
MVLVVYVDNFYWLVERYFYLGYIRSVADDNVLNDMWLELCVVEGDIQLLHSESVFSL